MSDLKSKIDEALRQVQDPELPVNIVDLGLIYDIAVDGSHAVIQMTLTTPNCPVAESMPGLVKESALGVDGIDDVEVELVWEPVWNSDMMSEDAQLMLEMMGVEWSDPRRAPTTSLMVGRKNVPGKRAE